MTKSTANKTTRKFAEEIAKWELIPLLRENFTDEREIQKITDQFLIEVLPLSDEIRSQGKRQLRGTFSSEAGLAAVKEWLTAVRTVAKATGPAK